MKTMALATGMLLTSVAAMAGDGTKENPYTVAELNAQKEALQAKAMTMLPFETNIVWVKADLKGLGEDGTLTDNADTEELGDDDKTKTVYHMAGLFGDATGEVFVAYSWQILGQVAMEDFTNTKDLLIALTYQEHSHTYANSENPWQGQNLEPDEFHFSLVEVYGALSLEIKNGYRGFHIPSCYVVPEGVCAVTVNAGYTNSNGAYVKYRYYDGADAQTNATPKNAALVLMANDGTYDFVLTTEYYVPVMANSNALYGGTQAGSNVGTKKNRARLRFVNDGAKVGFERNSQENATVILDSKDEIYLEVNSQNAHFYGHWQWETADQNWISWGGESYDALHADYAIFDFTSADLRGYIGTASNDTKGWIYNETYTDHFISLQVVTGTSPYKNYTDNNKGNCLAVYKDGFLIVRAPKGSAVTNIEFTLASGSDMKVTPSSGTLDGLVWTGNAEGVRFAVTATRYIANVAVTTADKDAETDALPAIEYVNCPNIAVFNALEDGTYALVSVDNAEVIGKSSDGVTTVYIQDATGGSALKYTSYNDLLTEKKRLFGRVYVRKMSSLMMEAEDAPKGEALPQDLNDFTVTRGTLADLNVTENLGRLVKISGASFEATGAMAGTLTQDYSTIAVNNGSASDIKYLHKIDATWVKDETKMENVTILGILVAKNASTNELLPLSMEERPYYTVAGGSVGIDGGQDVQLFGTSWDPTLTANDMVEVEDGIFRLEKKGFLLDAGNYECKVVMNHSWDNGSYPDQNVTFTVPATDSYNVTFTFNEQTKEVGVTVLKQFTVLLQTNAGWKDAYAYVWSGNGENEVLGKWPGTKMYFSTRYGWFETTFDAAVAPEKIIFNNGIEGEGHAQTEDLDFVNQKTYQYFIDNPDIEPSYTVVGAFNGSDGDDPVFKKSWNVNIDDNNMVKGEDGIYTLTLNNVELTTSGSILYKVVKNHSWNTESWGFSDKEDGNADYYVALPEDAIGATYNITFKFNPVATFQNGYQVDCEVTMVGVTTGIQNVGISATDNPTVFNMQGIRMSKVQKGLNIVRSANGGSQTKKVFIK
jgi:hypothetical protein